MRVAYDVQLERCRRLVDATACAEGDTEVMGRGGGVASPVIGNVCASQDWLVAREKGEHFSVMDVMELSQEDVTAVRTFCK